MELELAGIIFDVNTLHLEALRPLLSKYGVTNTIIDCNDSEFVPIAIEVSEQDIQSQKEKARSVFERRGEDYTVSDLECEFTALYKKILRQLIEHKVIYLHGSLLAVDGKGYLFMAPSGTGKSTHARLWRERFGERVTVINDDKPLVKVHEDGSIWAYGSPWNGKHRIGCNRSVPLSGIVRLRRGQENVIGKLGEMDAMKLLYMQTLHFEEKHKMELMLQVIGAIMEHVDFYDLQCNMELEAAEVAYEGIVTVNFLEN